VSEVIEVFSFASPPRSFQLLDAILNNAKVFVPKHQPWQRHSVAQLYGVVAIKLPRRPDGSVTTLPPAKAAALAAR